MLHIGLWSKFDSNWTSAFQILHFQIFSLVNFSALTTFSKELAELTLLIVIFVITNQKLLHVCT